jgi:hypothetical protein
MARHWQGLANLARFTPSAPYRIKCLPHQEDPGTIQVPCREGSAALKRQPVSVSVEEGKKGTCRMRMHMHTRQADQNGDQRPATSDQTSYRSWRITAQIIIRTVRIIWIFELETRNSKSKEAFPSFRQNKQPTQLLPSPSPSPPHHITYFASNLSSTTTPSFSA